MIKSARADREKICVLMMALFCRNTLCIARKSDEIRANIFRLTPQTIYSAFTQMEWADPARKVGRSSLASSHAGTRLPIAAISSTRRSPSARRGLTADADSPSFQKRKRKPEAPEMVSPEEYKLLSLRWHYPNQVQGSKVTPSSQPVLQAPRFFNFHHDTPDSALLQAVFQNNSGSPGLCVPMRHFPL